MPAEPSRRPSSLRTHIHIRQRLLIIHDNVLRLRQLDLAVLVLPLAEPQQLLATSPLPCLGPDAWQSEMQPWQERMHVT